MIDIIKLKIIEGGNKDEKKLLIVGFILSIIALAFSDTLVIKGSNTIFPVSQLWIEEIKTLYPDLIITLEGAGSSTGIASLFNGTADIANSSRWLKKRGNNSNG